EAVAGEADLGGTMRLGAYPAVLTKGSLVADAYGSTEVSERHRHRYEVNNDYRDKVAESGLRFSGTSPDGHLVEFVAYPVGPHPRFAAFVKASLDYENEMSLPVEPWRADQADDVLAGASSAAGAPDPELTSDDPVEGS